LRANGKSLVAAAFARKARSYDRNVGARLAGEREKACRYHIRAQARSYDRNVGARLAGEREKACRYHIRAQARSYAFVKALRSPRVTRFGSATP
jgi:hypothetical protein